MSDLEAQIEKLWAGRTEVNSSVGEARRRVRSGMDHLD